VHIDKDHGLISDWAQRRPTPSRDDLEQRLPGKDGSVPIKLPMLKLLEALEGEYMEMYTRHSTCCHVLLPCFVLL